MKMLAFTACCAMLAAGPALAGDTAANNEEVRYTRDLVVSFDDLDLTSKRDQRTLRNRLDRAAKAACGYTEIRTGTRSKDTEALRCYREARANARSTYDRVIDQHLNGG